MIMKLLPNVYRYRNAFQKSILETFWMMIRSSVWSLSIGLIFGILLVVTRKKGLYENKILYRILDQSMNFVRSIPFIILLTAIIPITKKVSGTYIGLDGIIFPLIVSSTPFFARQVEMTLLEVDDGLIETAEAMGFSKGQIIPKVYLRESFSGLMRSVSMMLISLLGLTTLGGAVGSGGLGDFVIRYGHVKNNLDVSLTAVMVILFFVLVIQGCTNFLIYLWERERL